MAEASSLASKIDRNFLECGICFEPFQDPRGLPCLHAFCCTCLVDWSKACSDDQSIVSCPLCKKVYQIPEGGVEGFPAHFLVTNLRETVDAERKTKSVIQHCENHAGEIKRYYCEDCGYSICSDCCAIDPIHKGHRFIRLTEFAKRQTDSLQNLFKKGKEVEKKYEIAIQQTEQVEQHLESAANAAKDTVHRIKKEVNQQLERYEQDINKRKDERIRQIHIVKEKLQVELATMKSALEQGTEAVNSGSEYEITSTYPFLSAKLQQLIQTLPMAADTKLSHIKFETPKINITSESELSCGKQKTAHTKSSVGNQVSFAAAPHSSPISPSKVSSQPNFASTTTMHSQSEATNQIKTKQSSVREIAGKRWNECGQIITTPQAAHPQGIAIQPNGDIAVTSQWAPVTVFSRHGDVKCVLKGSPVNAWDIAITPSNQYIIPDNNAFHIYNSQGTRLSTIPTYDVSNRSATPNSVAVDSRGRIITGLGYIELFGECKTVCIHQPDGTLISKFATPAFPDKIACTPDDELVISFDDGTLQVMDQSGHNARIIQSPPGIRSWWPRYVCCSKQGELFFSNHAWPYGNPAVYRYVYTGTGYQYTGFISTMVACPLGIALSANEEELFVVDNWNHCIKIFKY